MNFDITEDGVTRTIVADEEFVKENYPGAWAVSAEQPLAPVTNVACSPAQGLVALYALHNITQEDVLNAIAGISDPATRYTAQVAFNRATEWRRASPTMVQLAALLGLDDADLNALFAFAVGVEV